jgi:hypothetical protein
MPNYTATQDAIATGTSLKTLIEIATPATAAARVYHVWVDFDGISASAVPVLIELVRATASITGTTLTPSQVGTEGYATANVTAKHTASGGSGTNLGNVLMKRRISPTTGWELFLPDNRLITVGASAWLRMNVTAGATVNATVGFAWEE